MGWFGNENKGVDCVQNEDGSRTCRRVKINKSGEKMGTGTEVTVSVNPENCEPSYSGNMTIMDDEQEEIDDVTQKMVKGCKRSKGLA